ncbi:MAG: TonB-dependent receptor, partial [Balneolaceae bacterium]
MIRNLLYSVVVVLMFSGFSKAQNNASLDGYITDAKTGDSLISANIAFQNTKKGTSSDIRGYFTIQNINPGVDTLVFTYIGYEEFRIVINLNKGEKRTLEIELIPQNLELEDIVVQSQAGRKRQNEIEMVEVSIAFILNLPAVVESDVFRAVQLLPGIKASSDFSSGLYIRGGSPDQTLILFDNTPIYNPHHFFGFLSTFNPDAIENVRLYKGGYPAEYGGRLGSVLLINNKKGNAEKASGSITAGFLASRIALDGPFKNGSWMLAARHSTLDPLLKMLRKENDSIPNEFYFLDVNGRISFEPSTKDEFSLAFYSGKDQVRFPFEDYAEFHLDYGNQILSSNWKHTFSDKAFFDFSISAAQYFNQSEFHLTGTNFERENHIEDYSAKWNLEYAAKHNQYLSMGVWAGISSLKLQDNLYGTDNFANRLESKYASVYMQNEWMPSKKWRITPGLRFNYHSNGDYIRLEPRWSFEFIPAKRFRLLASFGHYNQFLTLNSNEAFSGFDVWLSAAEGVPPSSGNQVVFSVNTIPFEGYNFNIETYYRTMSDLFELDPFIPDVSGLAYEDLFRTGEGYAYGLEVFFEKQAGKLSGFIGYTLGNT